MLVATGSTQLMAKLQDKSRWRPTAMVELLKHTLRCLSGTT